MSPTHKSLRGLVLAGGLSTRMGCDKGALVHADGRTLVKRCYDLLREAGCESVALSLRDDQAIPPGFDGNERPLVFRDPPGINHGPLHGMAAALRSEPEADWLIVACDLPRLDRATLGNLVTSKNADEKFLSYRSEFDGLPEPLCALYSGGALPLLEDALANDFRCPRKILIRNDCRLLDPVTAGALHNANTPDDWEEAILP